MLPSGLPEAVSAPEPIARFLTSESYFNSSGVKGRAFMPTREHETSVCRHGAEPLEALWALAEEYLGSTCTCYGAGVLDAGQVRECRLDLYADEPPARHAAIRGWPVDQDPEEQKAKRMALALTLASAATMI